VFFGPRIPALAVVGDMRPRELFIGLTLLIPTLAIGFWPRLAIDVYEASTNALAQQLSATALVAMGRVTALG
jgi:NAD(P)H-quinone oxidoreductase subunit 4